MDIAAIEKFYCAAYAVLSLNGMSRSTTRQAVALTCEKFGLEQDGFRDIRDEFAGGQSRYEFMGREQIIEASGFDAADFDL